MPITEFTLPFSSAMASLKDLQEDCNTDERTSRCKLQSLELGVNEHGEKATLGEFKKKDSTGLGKLRFEEANDDGDGAEFKGRVFIKTQPVSILVFREA